MSEDFVGAGERTVVELLQCHFFNDQKRYMVGTQIPLINLITKDDLQDLNPIYMKHKVDVCVEELIGKKRIFAFPVQGRDHESGKTGQQHSIKGNKDEKIIKMMKNNKVIVVPILFRECPHIFDEKFDWTSMMELICMFMMSGVNLREI